MGRIRGYRGGYLPNERREIERGIREGEVLGVVSTNALELGIDIGSLQVAVLCGYPGSIASAWQQAGRAGRKQQTAVVVMVASSSPLNQYLMEHPEFFLGASPEEGILNPDNVLVLQSHLKCAVNEIPMDEDEPFAPSSAALLEHLESQRLVRRAGKRYHWASDSYPAEDVSLRDRHAAERDHPQHKRQQPGAGRGGLRFGSGTGPSACNLHAPGQDVLCRRAGLGAAEGICAVGGVGLLHRRDHQERSVCAARRRDGAGRGRLRPAAGCRNYLLATSATYAST